MATETETDVFERAAARRALDPVNFARQVVKRPAAYPPALVQRAREMTSGVIQ